MSKVGSDLLPKFSKDEYSRARGGTSKWLLLRCGSCSENFALYQKDGPGALMRLYINRICTFSYLTSPALVQELKECSPPTTLCCPYCRNNLGALFTYRDGRLAYALRRSHVQWSDAKRLIVKQNTWSD